MNVRCSSEEGRSLIALKKRLFIIVCNVLTAALLLLYVTYSQYRISMTATVQMPQAGQIYAALTLSPDQNGGAELDTMNTFLSRLAPGDNAMAFAGDENDQNHHFTVTVTNTQTIDDIEYAAQVDMEYRLRVYTTGHIPLEFVLVLDAGESGKEYYISQKIERDTETGHSKYQYCFVPYTAGSGGGTAGQIPRNEKVFSFQAGEAQTHTFAIYCGWDPSDEGGEYRKEVEHLEVRAELVSSPGTMQEPDEIIIARPVTDTP